MFARGRYVSSLNPGMSAKFVSIDGRKVSRTRVPVPLREERLCDLAAS